MSKTIPIEEAAARLADLISNLNPGDEIRITDKDRPVARIIPENKNGCHRPSGFGAMKGAMTIIADDDEHLADFKEYME